MLKQILSELQEVKAGQKDTNQRLDTMQAGIITMKDDIGRITEDTAVTQDVANGVSVWTEIASDVLKISCPLPKAE